MLRRTFLLLAALGCSPIATAKADNAVTPNLEVGQVWTIKRLENSWATIGRIDLNGNDTVVHISLSVELSTQTRELAGGDVEVSGTRFKIDHAPISLQAFLRSIDALVESGAPVPKGFEEGYAIWRGDTAGGVFTLEIPEIVSTLLSVATDPNARRSTQ